jgi:hypothetical protein
MLLMEEKLLLFPMPERRPQATRVDAKDLTDIFKRKVPMCICGINPFLSLLKKTAFMGFTSNEVGLETVNGIL